MNNLEELKKVALAATPGPWEKCDSYGPNENGTCISAVERPDLMIASTTGYYGRVGGIANTHFIALANPAVILDLIAQLEAAQKERDEFRRRLKLERSILEDTDKQLAELKALQPVAWRHDTLVMCNRIITTSDVVMRSWIAKGCKVTPLLTAAKPS
ncbi:hypothetical protein RSJ44_004725 [Yersinia enterocolitica]|uniref:ead/Ea22-like family protein n=1 Tax=Yersinia enterocolitica TaxID=630 RepID=UPI0028BB735B|nr:hypothetical protein [Yersinia enterocolitica]EKN5943912.1 hypothetical protein [Yersinia enterocolitica]ELI8407978.1 hypothetical protein [Yersinia enterocolitica]HDL7735823.1 hypothetical protein [Yersinia enterocolitica]